MQPWQTKIFINPQRIVSYFCPARSRSESSQASSWSNASRFTDLSLIPEAALFIITLLQRSGIELLLPPLTLKRKCGPVERRLPVFLPQHLNLRGSQRRRRSFALLEYLRVEFLHQLCRGLIVD